MPGEENLELLLKTLKPKLNVGDYVFCVIEDLSLIKFDEIISLFKEQEGITVILEKEYADKLKFPYSFVASWITLTVHSSLEAIGFTSRFSKALADERISCNVVAGFYHDHIFVDKNQAGKAMIVLNNLSRRDN